MLKKHRQWLWVLLPAIGLTLLVVSLATKIRRHDQESRARLDTLSAQSIAICLSSQVAASLLGAPIHCERIPGENLHETGQSGRAQLNFRVVGAQKTATLFVDATETAGVWKMDHLSVRPEGQTIWWDLLNAGRKEPE